MKANTPSPSTLVFLVLVLCALLGATAAVAGDDPINQTWRGIAIDGYDAVAYFEDAAAVEGDSDFTHDYMDAQWRFASAENRDRFAADPEAFAPQYGGYCAYAVSQGKTAGIDPEAWTVHDGKLYLNYNKKIRERWLADRDALIAQADANWPGVLD